MGLFTDPEGTPRSIEEIFELICAKVDRDWYEVTEMGFVARLSYWYQVGKYHLGLRKDPVNKDAEFTTMDFSFYEPFEPKNKKTPRKE